MAGGRGGRGQQQQEDAQEERTGGHVAVETRRSLGSERLGAEAWRMAD